MTRHDEPLVEQFIKHYASSRGPFAEPAQYHLCHHGLRSRARLLLSTAGARVSRAQATASAAACELVFESHVVRHDLIALEPSRRGREPVWRAYGEDTAIMLSDHLSASANQILATELPPQISQRAICLAAEAVTRAAAGQHLASNTTHEAGSLRQTYEKLARQTRGALLSLPLQLAGVLRNLPTDQVTHLGLCGEHLGLAHTILHDLAPGAKDARTDARHACISAPIVEARAIAPTVDPYQLIVTGGTALDQIHQRCRLWLVQAAGAAVDQAHPLPSDMRQAIRCYAERRLQAPSEAVAPIPLESAFA